MPINPHTLQVFSQQAVKYQKDKVDNFHHNMVEKPAMRALLPDIKGKTVLCLGCGTGEEVEFLTGMGAVVTGIDVSEGMIAVAKKTYPNLNFQVMNMEEMEFSPSSFDLVYSSLAIHYVEDWVNVMKQVYEMLKPGGILLFSTGHPATDSMEVVTLEEWEIKALGRARNEKTGEVKQWGNYLEERLMTEEWGNGFTISFYHKTLGTIFGNIRDAGFELISLVEPKPLPQAEKLYPDKFKLFSLYTKFIIFNCKKS